MARYIDADKLLKSAVSKFKCVPLVGVLSYRNGEECFDGLSFEEFINEHPTADVAPRSEVAREIFAEMGATAFTMHDDDSGEFILCMYCENFEELKQKYTEE